MNCALVGLVGAVNANPWVWLDDTVGLAAVGNDPLGHGNHICPDGTLFCKSLLSQACRQYVDLLFRGT
jgi:hypothetical protein